MAASARNGETKVLNFTDYTVLSLYVLGTEVASPSRALRYCPKDCTTY